MGRKIIWVLILALSGYLSSYSQGKLILDLDSAVNYALEYNKTLRNASLAVEEARQKVWESIATGLPQVDATLDYTNYLGAEMELRFSPDAQPTKIPFNPTSNFGVTLGQLIFSGNYIVGLQTAKLYQQSMQTRYEKSAQDVIEQVTNTYYLVLVAEESAGIIQKNLENIIDVYNKTKPLAEFGVLEQTDVDQLTVQVTMLENAVKSAERQIEVSYNMLRFYLGVTADTEIELSESLDDILSELNCEATLLSPFSVEENLDYQVMKFQEVISGKQVILEKMNYLPTVTGGYNFTKKILKSQFDITPQNRISLNASFPIFASGMRKARVSQARIRHETAKNNMELLSDQLLLQEKQYRYNLRNALEVYESQKKNVDVSKRVYDNINLKFQQGMVSSLDLTTANNNYLTAESNYINALLQLLEAQVALTKLFSGL